MSATGKAVCKITKTRIYYLFILHFAGVCNHGKRNTSTAISPYHSNSLIKSFFTGKLIYLSPI